MRIAVAMSGGVDSSVTAALLHAEGHEVVGLTMRLHSGCGETEPPPGRACCTARDVRDAAAVASRIGFAFHTVDLREEFRRHVVLPFVDSYVLGRTPNPCILCNDVLKFDLLLARARALGCEALATGHYARLVLEDDGGVSLRRGRDPRKDQSYFLAGMPRDALAFLRFPLGDRTKDDVRRLATAFGLSVASKPESQEVCFVPDGDVGGFVERTHAGALRGPGPIVDRGGRVRGQHRGLHFYTVGQRRGLAIAAPAPLYVLALDVAGNRLVVGPREEAMTQRVTAVPPHWLAAAPPDLPLDALVQVRYRSPAVPATVASTPDGAGLVARLAVSVLAPAPGQALVLYDRDRVLGSATIAGTDAGGAP